MSTQQSIKPSHERNEMSRSSYDYPVSVETTCHGPGFPGGPDVISGPLGIDDFEVPGVPQPYAFLIQRPLSPPHEASDAPFGFVPVHVRARDADGQRVGDAHVKDRWDPAWTWEVITTDNEIRLACMGRWYAQAACASGLTAFQVTNPEGTVFQQPLPMGKQSLHGHFMMQGFRVKTIKDIALDWARTPTPKGGDGNHLPLGEGEWDLVGGQAPATAFDRLYLEAHCSEEISDHYEPKIKLKVFPTELP